MGLFGDAQERNKVFARHMDEVEEIVRGGLAVAILDVLHNDVRDRKRVLEVVKGMFFKVLKETGRPAGAPDGFFGNAMILSDVETRAGEIAQSLMENRVSPSAISRGRNSAQPNSGHDGPESRPDEDPIPPEIQAAVVRARSEAYGMLANGIAPEHVVSFLSSAGFPDDIAKRIVQGVLAERGANSFRRGGCCSAAVLLFTALLVGIGVLAIA